MSWLYDIEFELLNDKNTDKVICVGRDKYNIALRMKYAGFKSNQIKIYDSLEEAKDMIKNKSKGDIFANRLKICDNVMQTGILTTNTSFIGEKG